MLDWSKGPSYLILSENRVNVFWYEGHRASAITDQAISYVLKLAAADIRVDLKCTDILDLLRLTFTITYSHQVAHLLICFLVIYK